MIEQSLGGAYNLRINRFQASAPTIPCASASAAIFPSLSTDGLSSGVIRVC